MRLDRVQAGRDIVTVIAPREVPSRYPLPATQPLPMLVDITNVAGDDLPLVRDLDPYRLGATPSQYGDSSTYGERDPYLPRTAGDVEHRIQNAIERQRIVVIYGQSKAGKTRTAFESVRGWPDARLLAPRPSTIGSLTGHPALQDMDGDLVVWLDDLDEYFTASDSLTSTGLTDLRRRPGRTVVIATLRLEVRERLAAENGGTLTREIRQLLNNAVEIALHPTSDSAVEQDLAASLYPDEDLSGVGLAEQLAGGPAVLRLYRDSRASNPVRFSILQAAIDWARVGIHRSVPEADLCELAADAIQTNYPYLTVSTAKINETIRAASAPVFGHGRIFPLRTDRSTDGSRGYRAFEYLVAADDGQSGTPRPISGEFWTKVMQLMHPDEAFAVTKAAVVRGEIPMSIGAARKGAEAGEPKAMNALGILLAGYRDPPQRDEARRWFAEAVEKGSTKALTNLALILAQDDPPDTAGAILLFTQAAELGSVIAMRNLGLTLLELDPPDLVGAREWIKRAADAGEILSMMALADLCRHQETPPDPEEADRWMKRAAEAEPTVLPDVESMASVGLEYARQYSRTNERLYLKLARGWLTRAAEAGDALSMNHLGYLFARLQNPSDLGNAKYWLTRAAETGEPDAMVNLTYLYAYLEAPPDFALAEMWHARAKSAGVADVQLRQAQLDDLA